MSMQMNLIHLRSSITSIGRVHFIPCKGMQCVLSGNFQSPNGFPPGSIVST